MIPYCIYCDFHEHIWFMGGDILSIFKIFSKWNKKGWGRPPGPYSKCKLKLMTIHKYLLCPCKRQMSRLRFIALRGVTISTNVAHLHYIIAAVVQWVRALAPQAEGWVFESQPRQT